MQTRIFKNSFDLVEHTIGRRLEDCFNIPPGPDTVEVTPNCHVWRISYDLWKTMIAAVIEHYRTRPRLLKVRSEIRPFVDSYDVLHLSLMVGNTDLKQRVRISDGFRRTYISTRASGRTIYTMNREMLPFLDGTSTGDPFILMSKSVITNAIRSTEYQKNMGALPPTRIILDSFSDDDLALEKGFEIESYLAIWASTLQEALEIRDLVDAGLIELVPGISSGFQTSRLMEREEKSPFFLPTLAKIAQENATNAAELTDVLRAGQQIVDASHYQGASIFLHNDAQLRHAFKLLEAGIDVGTQSRAKLMQSQLHTMIGIDGSQLSHQDLINLRRDDETMATWRSIREELAGACLDSHTANELSELRGDLSDKWLQRLIKERERESVLAQGFRKEAFRFGVLGGAVAGGLAAISGAGAMMALAQLGGGALLGGGPKAWEWYGTHERGKIRKASQIALQRHLVSLADEDKSGKLLRA